MKAISRDARSFVHGVVDYLRKEGKTPTALPRVRTLFHKVTSQAKQQNQAWVDSAIALAPEEKSMVKNVLATLVGHSLSVSFQIKKELIGGIRIRVADWIVDTSFTSQLNEMKQSMLQT